MSGSVLRGTAVAASLVLVTFALGLVIWIAAVRTEIRTVDVSPIVTTPITTPAVTTSSSVPCCAAGTGGASEGIVP